MQRKLVVVAFVIAKAENTLPTNQRDDKLTELNHYTRMAYKK
jgi:hypothetical protein